MGNRVGTHKFSYHVRVSHQQGSGSITEPHLIEIGCFGQTFVRSRDQHLFFVTAPDRGKGLYEACGARPFR